MDKFWLSQYQQGVPTEINPNIYSSLPEMFDIPFNQYSDRISFTNAGTDISYAKLYLLSKQVAAYLQQMGLKKGARIAIMMPNVLQYPILIFAILRAGFVVVNVNPLYTASELTHQMNDCSVEVIFVLANFAHVVKQSLPDMPSVKEVVVTELGDCFPTLKKIAANILVKYIHKMVPSYSEMQHIKFTDILRIGANSSYTKPNIQSEDIAFIQYTGGTTGVSKGAILSHRNLIANILQTTAWVSTIKKEKEQIIVTALPLYHIFSLTANCFTFFMIGSKNILITNPRDTKGFINAIKNAKITAITGVNTLYDSLLRHPKFNKINFKHLNIALSGGMALQKNVASQWQKATDMPILEAYGLTETSPAVTINPLNTKIYTGSVGLPLPSTNIAIRDENGNDLPIDEIGELSVSGPQVMSEYWQKPEETKLEFWPDGFLRTGDSARIDRLGYVYLVDRIKDLIIVSGFNVYPHQVEDVIMQLPGVLEVAVIGVNKQTGRELVKACVVKNDPSLTEEEILNHCRENLTAYKIPKQIEFYEELPKTNVGKILKRAIK
ncbi:MAG: AMP-binding protein [Legionellaceae bacterium]|nr:AMP-binding protein [Legionellaceae bacterium]